MSIDLILILIFAIFIIGLAAICIIWLFIVGSLRPIIGASRVRTWKSYLVGAYLRMVRALCCDFELILSGDLDKIKETRNKKSIYLQNHQTEMDWLYAQYIYQAFDKQGCFSAIMKGSLGSIPVIGYALKDVHMCLLDRNWTTDRQHFDTFLENYISAAHPISVLLCPEGTTFTNKNYLRSQEYAKKTGRPCLEHLLLPRSTGLAYLLKHLADDTKVSGEEYYIYDTTMQFNGYHGEVCSDSYERVKDVDFPTIVDTLWGRKKIVCHLHVRVIPVTDVVKPDTPLEEVNKQVEKWLDERWLLKEEQMNYFIEHQTFTDDWTKNQRVEEWTRGRKLRDSMQWMPLLLSSIGIHYSIFKFIKWVIFSVISHGVN